MIILNDKNYDIWKMQLLRFAEDNRSRSILKGDVDQNNPASLKGLNLSFFTDHRNLPNEEELMFFEFSVLPSSLTEPEKEFKKRQLEYTLSNKHQSEYYRRLFKLNDYLFDSITGDLQLEVLHLNKPHEIFKHLASRYEVDDPITSQIHDSVPKDLQAEDLHLHNPHEIFKHATSEYEGINYLTSHRNLCYLMDMKFTYGSDLAKFFAEMKRVWAMLRGQGPYRLIPVDVLMGTILIAMPKEMTKSVEIAQHLCSETDSPQKLMDELVRLYTTDHKDARDSQYSTFSSDFQSSAKCGFCRLRGVKKVNHTSAACRSNRAPQAILDPDTNSSEVPEALSHTAGKPHDPESAIFSTGVALHTTGRRDLFVDFTTIPPISILGVNGTRSQASGIGKVRFQYVVGKSIRTMELHDAYFVKDFPTTFISVSRLSRFNFGFHIVPYLHYSLIINSDFRPLFKIPLKDGVPKIKISN